MILYSYIVNWHYADQTQLPSAAPTQPNNGAFIGVIAALVALFLSTLGACVPVIAYIYCRSKYSRKLHTADRYFVLICDWCVSVFRIWIHKYIESTTTCCPIPFIGNSKIPSWMVCTYITAILLQSSYPDQNDNIRHSQSSKGGNIVNVH